MSSTTGFVVKTETTPLVENQTVYPMGGEYYQYQTPMVKSTTVGCGVGCTGVMPTTVETTTTVVPTTVGTTTVQQSTLPYNVYKYVVDVVNTAEDSYLTGHQIDGRILYPTTGYLYLVWKSLAKINGFTSIEQMPITFENVEIHRATILAVKQQMPLTKQIEFCVRIVPKTGVFELVEGENVIVTGRVAIHESIAKLEQLKMLVHQHLTHLTERRRLVELLEQEEIYRELRMRGYEYNGEFQPLIRADLEGTCGELLWTGKWIPFLDAMLQLNTLSQRRTVGGLLLPTRIRCIRIDPFAHSQVQKLVTKMVKSVSLPVSFRSVLGGLGEQRPYVLPVVFDPITSRMVCGGVEIVGLQHTGIQNWLPTVPVVTPVNGSQFVSTPVTFGGVQNFVPYVEKHFDEEYVIVDKCGVVEPEQTTGLFRQNREFLEFYLNECKRYVSHILRKIEQPTVVVQSIVPTMIPRTLEQQLEALKIVPSVQTTSTQTYLPNFLGAEIMGTPYGKLLESGRLLQLLLNVANIDSTDGQYLYKVQKIFTDKFAYLRALEEDAILNLVNNRSYYLKSILDTVLENTHHIYTMPVGVMPVRNSAEAFIPRLKVLEISPSMGHFFGAKVSNLMRLYPTRIGEIDYHYVPSMIGVHPSTVVPEEYIAEINKQLPYEIKKVEWNFGLKNGQLITEVPSHLREYDLVILNGGLSSLLPYVESEYELKRWLQTVVMDKVLKPQGFLFVHEYTNSFDLLSQLTRLEHSVVLTSQTTPMVTPFKYTTGRFPYNKYQSEMQWRQLIEECGFYPVSMKSDVELSSMFLYRRPLNWTLTNNAVVEEKILIDELERVELIKRVRVALLEKQLERVWLLSEREPTVELVALVNMLRREIGGEKLRCLFVADRNPINVFGQRFMVPTTSFNELVQMPLVQTQWSELFHTIRRADLVMNVFRQGQWGSFRPLVNVRGLYPLTTPVFPFVHGSALPFPVLSSTWTGCPTTTGTTGARMLTMPSFTHLPIGYPFEFYPQQQQQFYPQQQQQQYYTQQQQQQYYPQQPFIVEPIVSTVNGVFSPMTTTTTTVSPVVLPTGREFIENGGQFVEPSSVMYTTPTTVKSVIYRRQQQLTTTTTTTTVPTTTVSGALPQQRVLLNPLQTYIITCGLGSFGLELVEWAIEHGARRVILTTKYGVRTGYQARKLRILRDEYNAQIQVLQVDVREEVECMSLIKEAVAMSVENKIGGIFHLASCIEDALFEQQQQQYPGTQVHEILRRITEFRCQGAYNLDRLTRQQTVAEGIMDEQAYFVVFSPFVSATGAGPITTTSVLEKICESRRRVGRHGLAVHWGCTVDSGLWLEKIFAYDNIVEPTYVVPNRIFSILRIMENILIKSVEPTVFSHYVPIDKFWLPETVNQTYPYQSIYQSTYPTYPTYPTYQQQVGGVYPTVTGIQQAGQFYQPTMQCMPMTTVVSQQQQQQQREQYKSLVELILTVMGVKDFSRVYGCESVVTLGELGLDAVLALELKQLFETVYNLPQLNVRDILALTIEKLRLIESRYPQGINELYMPRPLNFLPRLRSVILRKNIF